MNFLSQLSLVIACSGILSILGCGIIEEKRIKSESSLPSSDIEKQENLNPLKDEHTEAFSSSGGAEASGEDSKIPNRPVNLPDIGFDKSKLPNVMKLDQLILDEANLAASHQLVYEETKQFEGLSQTSMSGTAADQMKAIMTMVNGAHHYRSYAKTIAENAIEYFSSRYESNRAFDELYRETYYQAEAEISGPVVDDGSQIIEDNKERQAVWGNFKSAYQPAIYCELDALKDLLDESEDLIKGIINNVVTQAKIDLMVADYKKGKALADLLNGTVNQLNAVKVLDFENKEILGMIAEVEGKKKSRRQEIAVALEEYRFPSRYDQGNAPVNMDVLENRMKSFLGGFNYTEDHKYEIMEIAVAGPWIDLHHALTGDHIYSQIDFYVVVPSAEAGLLDVLLVTGKTNGAHHNDFGTYSVGGIGQMLPKNL